MKVEEANKIKDWIIKECKKSPEYKKLTSRAFCDHAGYSKYKEVATEIATQLITIPQAVQLNKTLDPTWGACTYAFWQATLSPNFPVYALTKELMEGFINSQPPSQLWGLRMPFDRALIMLPQNTLISPDGYSLNWLLINFLEPFHEEKRDNAYLKYVGAKCGFNIKHNIVNRKGIDSFRLRWVTSLDLNYIYSSTTELPSPENEHPIAGFNYYVNGNAQTEALFINQVSGLVFQILLYMISRKPESVNAITKISKHQRRPDPKAERNFIWVGKEYKHQRQSPQGGTHNSPVGHFRRGHYRVLSWREADKQEIWVRPTWVS